MESTYWGLHSPNEVIEYVERCLASPLVGIDTETTGTARWRDRMVGLSLSAQHGEGVYIPTGHAEGHGPNVSILAIREAIVHLLRTATFAMHHSHFDMVILALAFGIEPWEITLAHDTMIMAQLRGEARGLGGGEGAGLKTMAKTHLGVERHDFSDFFPDNVSKADKSAALIDLDLMIPYAAADADDVLGLVRTVEPTLDPMGLRFTYDLEMALVPEMLWLEARGVPIDTRWCGMYAAAGLSWADEVERLVRDAFAARLGRPATVTVKNGWTKPKDHPEREQKWKEVPVNLGSTDQLSQLLFDKTPAEGGKGMGLPVHHLTSGGKSGIQKPSTDDKALTALANYEPALGWLLAAREARKLVSTYLDPKAAYTANTRVEDGLNILHPTYKQVGPETGRTACEDPNMQNVPKDQEIGLDPDRALPEHIEPFVCSARDMVRPRPGYYLLDMDWAIVEYRVIAGFSQDPGLLDVFETGTDLHVKTASLMWGIPEEQVTKALRGKGKTMNYRVAFGGGAPNVAEAIPCSLDEAKDLLARRKAAFPYETQWKESIEDFARKNRYVQTYFGRKRFFNFNPNATEGPERKAYFAALREAVNMPVQGTAADLLKMTLVRLGPWLRAYFPDVRTVLTTHDSITMEVPLSIDPVYFSEALRPVVEFPKGFIPGWPAIIADFEWGDRWGSLKKVRAEEPLDADLNGVAGFPGHEDEAVTFRGLEVPPTPLVLRVDDITTVQAAQLRDFLATVPGQNPLTLQVGAQQMELAPTSLEAGQGFVLAHIFPDARLEAAVDFSYLA